VAQIWQRILIIDCQYITLTLIIWKKATQTPCYRHVCWTLLTLLFRAMHINLNCALRCNEQITKVDQSSQGTYPSHVDTCLIPKNDWKNDTDIHYCLWEITKILGNNQLTLICNWNKHTNLNTLLQFYHCSQLLRLIVIL
jgi:hypothetical protein